MHQTATRGHQRIVWCVVDFIYLPLGTENHEFSEAENGEAVRGGP